MHYVQIRIVLVKLLCAVDASQAGRGTLDIAVVSKGESVPVSARAMQGPEFLEVVYTPIYVATHLINVRFNGEPVPGQYASEHLCSTYWEPHKAALKHYYKMTYRVAFLRYQDHHVLCLVV